MNKNLIRISKVVMLLVFLNIFSWAIFHVHSNGTLLGPFTKPLIYFSTFPTKVMDVFREVEKPERLLTVKKGFERVNKLDFDFYLLHSIFEDSQWRIKLKNCRTDSIIYTWNLENKLYRMSDRQFANAAPLTPILLKDTSVVVLNDDSYNLYRINKNSKVIWHNSDLRFHHAIQQDHEGNIYACTESTVVLKENDISYYDHCITKLDLETGSVLFHKSISEILVENNLSYYLHGFGSEDYFKSGEDPIHLNEVQPALNSSEYWKKGDLFLSIRNRSAIIIYRPANNKIIRILHGPFFYQHDVDIISDSSISIFNNNITSLMGAHLKPEGNAAGKQILANPYQNLVNQVVIYNFKDSSFQTLYEEQFIKHKVFTESQGLHHIFSNGAILVEEADTGILYVFDGEELKLRTYGSEPKNGLAEPPHWVRVYEDINFVFP